MNIECPKCNYNNEDVNEFLSKFACEDTVFQCLQCDHEFMIGWVAEVEIRDDKLDK